MQTMQWTKAGDFNPAASFNEIVYTNQFKQHILTIHRSPIGTYSLVYEIPINELNAEAVMKYKFAYSSKSLAVRNLQKGHKRFRELLEVIALHASLDQIRLEIDVFLGLRLSAEELSENLSQHTQSGDLEKTIELAKKYQREGYEGVIYQLAKSFQQNNVNDTIIIDLYKSVPRHDPYFKKANGKLYILCGNVQAPTIPHQQQQLIYALNSGERLFIVYAFKALSGEDIYSNKFNGLQWNEETLITIAQIYREQNEQNAKLSKRIEELTLKVEELTALIKQSNSTTFSTATSASNTHSIFSISNAFPNATTNINPVVTTTTNAGVSTATTATTTTTVTNIAALSQSN